jgi:hypothetical protein
MTPATPSLRAALVVASLAVAGGCVCGPSGVGQPCSSPDTMSQGETCEQRLVCVSMNGPAPVACSQAIHDGCFGVCAPSCGGGTGCQPPCSCLGFYCGDPATLRPDGCPGP